MDNVTGNEVASQTADSSAEVSSAEVNITGSQELNESLAHHLQGYDIKNADVSNLGLEALNGKYKTVAELEKAYSNLHGRFGSFTGAPEAYDFGESEAPGEWVTNWAKEANLSQDGLNSLLSVYNEQQAAAQEAYFNEQREKLGADGEKIMSNLQAWGEANGVNAETMQSMFGSAEQVMALQSLMKASGGSVPASNDVAAQPAMTKDHLTELQLATDQYGNRKMEVDPEYAAMVMRKTEEYLATH